MTDVLNVSAYTYYDADTGWLNNNQNTLFGGNMSALGNVGIGTASPVSKLDVNGNVNIQGSYLDFIPTNPWLRVTTGPGTFTIGDDDNVSLSNGKLYVQNNGNVGIGTTTP